MDSLIFYSPLIITLLMAVGLFFFIRASVKDRTEQETYESEVAPETLRAAVEAYFNKRAYTLVAEDPTLVYQGMIRPSVFLAAFLTLLALGGLGSLALILIVLMPSVGGWWGLLLSLCPLAGIFYWQKAQHPERIKLRLDPGPIKTKLCIQGHRDEIERFKRSLGFE